MNPFSILFVEIIYRPIFNVLILLLELFQGNLGLAIIGLTLVVRFALLKTSVAQNDMQKDMTDLQPKMHEIQEKYKENPEKQAQELMNIMKTKGAKPLKGCLMALIQIPVFLGLFFVISDFAQSFKKIDAVSYQSLYSFFDFFGKSFFESIDGIMNFNVESINHFFIGVDLFKSGNIILAILAGILMYFQMKVAMLNKPSMPKANLPGVPNIPDMSKMMGFMNIFLVFMIGSFVLSMPSGIGFYIITTSLFSLVQTSIQYKEVLRAKFQALLMKK